VKLKVSWRELPQEVRAHLTARLKDRSITADDLYKLQVWIELDLRCRMDRGTGILEPSNWLVVVRWS
jgi:hypothetical protein